MAITDRNRAHGRQYPLVAIQDFTLAELTSGSAIGIVKLPANARVIGGGIMITEVFNSGTSDVVDIGDAIDADRHSATPVDVTALGFTAFDITGYKYTTTDWLDITLTAVGTAATTGTGTLIVEYVVDGRANEVVPDYD